MPVMDGFDSTTAILKLEKEHRGDEGEELTHIVALTSYSTLAVKNRCLKIGMKGLYNKPLKHTQLKTIMDSHYTRHV